jgi:hypothetical protein
VNLFHDASHSLITALSFHHSQISFPPTPKIAAALQFPFSDAHQTTSHLNFPVYDGLLDLWHPSSITMLHDILEQAPPML